MGAGVLSFTLGDVVQGALHIPGYVVGLVVFAALFGLILRYGPQGWR